MRLFGRSHGGFVSGRVWSSSGRVDVVYRPDEAVGCAWM